MKLLSSIAAFCLLSPALFAAGSKPAAYQPARAAAPHAAAYRPVVIPGGATLPYEMKSGVKVFHLVAEPVEQEIAPGMTIKAWGFNGRSPGPAIEAVEGDRVRILVTNRLPEATAIHWHGILLPEGMDGIHGLTQPPIEPGTTVAYEFTLRQHGTYMYHSHSDETLQMAQGMMGFFIIHPRVTESPRIDRDYAIFLNEMYVEPGSKVPNPAVMTDFNLFTFNGKAYPGTTPLYAQLGERVRIRYANISMDSHPIHLHGHRFWITANDGGQIPRSAWIPETTVNVMPGTTQEIQFVADNPGDWPLHCHKSHHAMNAMGHEVPNLLGVNLDGVDGKIAGQVPGYMAMGQTGGHDMGAMQMRLPDNTLPMMAGEGQFGMIGMGGMFTIVKIRARIKDGEDPGPYQHPPGTLPWLVNEAGEPISEPPTPVKPHSSHGGHGGMNMPGMSMPGMVMPPPSPPAPSAPGSSPAPKPSTGDAGHHH